MAILELVGNANGELPKRVRVILSIPDIIAIGSKIIDRLSAKQGKLIMEYTSKHLPPIVIIKGNEVSFPTIRFWEFKLDDEVFIGVSGDDQPMSTNGMFEMAYAITKVLLETKPREVIVLGTIISEKAKEGGIYTVAPGKEGPGGEILGLNGMIPAMMYEMEKIPYKVITVALKNPAFVGINENEVCGSLIRELERVTGHKIDSCESEDNEFAKAIYS